MEKSEIWRAVNGYEGLYEVSSLGNVRNVNSGRVLNFCRHRSGYLSVMLYKGRKPKRFNVHRLVATAFLNNSSNYEFVNHIDEDKSNNNADNLEWCSREHNMKHGTASARISEKRGHSPRRNGRPVAQIGDDGEVLRTFKSIASASRETGTARTSIWECCNGIHVKANNTRWVYLTQEVF